MTFESRTWGLTHRALDPSMHSAGNSGCEDRGNQNHDASTAAPTMMIQSRCFSCPRRNGFNGMKGPKERPVGESPPW